LLTIGKPFAQSILGMHTAYVSVRMGLLALLDDEPRYGYQLRAEFEQRTGGTWPLNVGQVYTTLGRLVRDGWASVDGESGDDTRVYRATPEGHAQVAGWFATPVGREVAPREELSIKLALAVDMPGANVRDIVQRQRAETIRALQTITRDKAGTPAENVAKLLVLEAQIAQLQAEAAWLDHAEALLTRYRPAARHSLPGGTR
jgi:DNA-binding PadR family transcriptional regulator